MHNPLALLTPELLDSLIASGYQYFVRQSYPRGKSPADDRVWEAFLITPYMEFTQVNAHFQAIKFDSRKFVYQVDYLSERDKLYIAAAQPKGYKIFVSLLREKKWKPSPVLATKIKNYLRAFSSWKPERGDGVSAALSIQFGELFIILRYRTNELKVPLVDIEKI